MSAKQTSKPTQESLEMRMGDRSRRGGARRSDGGRSARRSTALAIAGG